MIVVVTIYQFMIVRSDDSKYCRFEREQLVSENEWLNILMILQIKKVFVFTLWQNGMIEQEMSEIAKSANSSQKQA